MGPFLCKAINNISQAPIGWNFSWSQRSIKQTSQQWRYSSCAVSFKMYGDMPSGPVDLFTFNFVRRLTTLGEVTSMCSSIFGYLWQDKWNDSLFSLVSEWKVVIQRICFVSVGVQWSVVCFQWRNEYPLVHFFYFLWESKRLVSLH